MMDVYLESRTGVTTYLGKVRPDRALGSNPRLSAQGRLHRRSKSVSNAGVR